jgi:hypothetical protein
VRIQLIYTAGCPLRAATRDALWLAIADVRPECSIQEIDAATDASLAHWPSPTVLIDGVPIGGATSDTALDEATIAAALRQRSPARESPSEPPDA